MPETDATDDALAPQSFVYESGGMPALPRPSAPAPASAREKPAENKHQRFADEMSSTMRQENARMQPLYRAEAAALNRPQPQVPQMRQAGPPPQQQVDPSAWLMAAGVIGAIAGSLGRRHVTNGLAAFTGALEGMKEGSQTKFENSYKTWEAENKQAQEVFSQQMQSYDAVLKRNDLNVQQKAMAIDLAARARHDDYMIKVAEHAVRTGDFGLLAAAIDGKQGAISSYIAQSNHLKEMVEQRRQAQLDRLEAIKYRSDLGGALSPEAEKMRAEQAKAGDPSAFQNLGRGTQGARNVVGITNELAKTGISGAELARNRAEFEGQKSGERALASRTVSFGIRDESVTNAFNLVKQASDGLPRGNWVQLNEAIQKGEAAISDPRLRRLVASINTAINEYAGVVNFGGPPRISDKDHARELLSAADGPRAINAALEQLAKEVQGSERAFDRIRERMRTGQPIGQAQENKQPRLPPGWTIREVP